MEGLAKEVLNHNRIALSKKVGINELAYHLFDTMSDLRDVEVEIPTAGLNFQSFSGWDVTQVGENGTVRYEIAGGGEVPRWWSDYNKVKHSRTARNDSEGMISLMEWDPRDEVSDGGE